jgi:vitamin K-dependent gamma-carboxylase
VNVSFGRRTAKGGGHIRSPSLAPLALAPASPYRPSLRELSLHEEQIITSLRQVALRISTTLAKRVDGASLAIWRICFGVIIAWEAWRYLSKDWIEKYWLDSQFHFTYFGFSWVHPLSHDLLYTVFVVLGVAGIALALGVWYRLSAGVIILAFAYQFLLEQARYLNHFYAATLFAIIFIAIPADSVFVLRRQHREGDGTVPAWALWLVRFQVGVIYGFAGVAKLNDDWRSGFPWRDWLEARQSLPGVSALLSSGWEDVVFGFGGTLFDLLIVPALLWSRTRVPAFCAALAFHFINANLFNIGIFPWMMAAATLIFFPPAWPRTLLSRVSSRFSVAAPAPQPPQPLRRRVLWGLMIYVTLQLFLPLRHWLYPGDVAWTEEGHRFSWRMKLRTKEGAARFYVTRDGKVDEVNPLEFLDSRQYTKMSGQPDMLLQFAHFLARTFPQQNGQPAEVRVVAFVSLNDRPYGLLVDSLVNLAAQPRSLRHAAWITPYGPSRSVRPLP